MSRKSGLEKKKRHENYIIRADEYTDIPSNSLISVIWQIQPYVRIYKSTCEILIPYRPCRNYISRKNFTQNLGRFCLSMK